MTFLSLREVHFKRQLSNQSRKLHPGQLVQDCLQLGLCLASHLNTIILQPENDTFCEHILKKLDFHISSKKAVSPRNGTGATQQAAVTALTLMLLPEVSM